MGILNKGSSLLAGIGLGGAARAGAEPVLEVAKQNAWYRRQNKVIDPETAAAASAQQLDTDQHFVSYDENGKEVGRSDQGATAVDLMDDFKRQGFSEQRFNLARRLMQRVPPYAEALTLWRRERIDEDTVDAILAREGIPPGLWKALKELVGERADPETMANAVQQSFVDDAGLLAPIEDGPPFNIPLETVPIDTLKEFKASGIDKHRARLLALLAGNPPAPDQLANMVMRSQISDQTFIHGLREGRTKTKWAKALLYYLTHPLLNPGTLVQRRLRGYDDAATYHRRMANYGYTAEQADDWFEASGRPLAPQQMLDLIARKGPSPTGGVFDFADFKQGMVESDIKPKYSTPAEALYYKYPPLFQLRRAVESQGMTKERAREIMHIERYEPKDIESLLASWKDSGSTTDDPHVTKAHNSLWTTMVQSYTAAESDAAALEPGFDLLNVPAAARTEVITALDARRELIRKQLTPAQIKKAMSKAVPNEATGLPWSYDDALAALLSRGWPHGDASTFLKT